MLYEHPLHSQQNKDVKEKILHTYKRNAALIYVSNSLDQSCTVTY